MTNGDIVAWRRLDEAFDTVLDVPAEDRVAWIEENFSSDPDLAGELVRLLAVARGGDDFFDSLEDARDRLLSEAIDWGAEEAGDPRIGAVYGSWRILRQIGRGGFAVVYEAERADGRYEQICALKVIQGGLRGDAVRHFLRERRILSTLDHPGLVRIIDAGETATGAPWLVMDLAEGRNITDHCREAALGLMDRIGLAAGIADALQAAHSRLVIHRDIKPDNIIVSSEGRARLLDFGVASLASGNEGNMAATAMTPQYASPEQRALSDVTTASDIYQLGLVLKELCLPYVPLSRPIQAVIDKATAEDPGARYESASGFAEDLRRVMRGDPPLARPETRWEAVRRLILQNRVVSVLVTVVLAGLVAWMVTLDIHARQLETQRAIALSAADRAERGRAVLLDIFRRMDPVQEYGAAAVFGGLQDVIHPALADVRDRLSDDPALQAELLAWAAFLNERAGEEAKALEYTQEAIQLLEAAGLGGTSLHADRIAYRGSLRIARGDREGGEADLSEALLIARQAPQNDRFALSVFIRSAGAKHPLWQEQRALFEEALKRLPGASTNSEIEVRTGLARALLELGDVSGAEAHLRLGLEQAERVYGPDHPRLALPLSVLGSTMRRRGDLDNAIEIHRRAYQLSETAFGRDYKSTLSHQNNLALSLADAGRIEEAAELINSLAEAYLRLDGPGSRRAGETYQNLATLQVRAGGYDAALHSLDKAEPILALSLPETAPMRAYPLLTRSEALLNLHRYAEAKVAADAAFMKLTEILPQGHFAIEIARCRMGLARAGQGEEEAAAHLIREAISGLAALDSPPERHQSACFAAALALGIEL
ncbi:serine/threonine-protein kinase [Hyphomonas sp. WL0036]|uniref:serine/threonine-protein kinase n=1 Tax=Hyphomonas sediminis TaxID=2866160 RepID=UPI001C7F6370|nr:serine/threonine-protein kinase [Hyphomonas sediminis]MBY9068166.1 serine/threonine-protein kinase [Hyphomonas sediminis]